MSGAHVNWTPERRKHQAELIRARNLLDPPSRKPGVGRKISAALKGRPNPHSAEWEQHRTAAMRTPAVRAKAAVATRQRFLNPAVKAAHGRRMREVLVARGCSAAERAELSRRAKRHWSPEKQARMLLRLRSPEVRQKISAGQRGRKHPWSRIRNMVLGLAAARRSGGTSLERALERLLCSAGIPFVREHPLGRAIADAYSPAPLRLVWEADEPHWHDPDRDRARDARLLERPDVDAVIRLSPEELQPWLSS